MTSAMDVAVRASLQDAGVHEPLQTFREHRSAHAETGLEVLEAADPCEGLSQNDQRPSVAEQRQRSKYRARFVGQVVMAHVSGYHLRSKNESS